MKQRKFLNTIIAFSFLVGGTLLVTNCEVDETQKVANLTNLVMSDEFDVDGAPDPDLWGYDLGDGTAQGLPAGWGNNELQVYTDSPDNVSVENGLLVITARQVGANQYTSARLTTQVNFDQQYGRFEARMRLPLGKGIWPAFWLLGNDCDENPWPQCGEIDVMEYLGDAPTVIFGSAHGPGYNGGDSISKEYDLGNDRFDTGFHVFGIEWGPDFINYYVDGDLYQQITPEITAEEAIEKDGITNPGEWVFNRPFYIIMNIAVGGDLPGAPNADTVFPQRMFVDYVRVYN
ncbi:glycoside hydrolase family 16 protein [Winogradskyella sp. DF17]|uniref:Glycoside hydrolase family 16 protein n=1 Tax=Winogradskyella pelagia TaxID=2819984 RepID=A0ABS3T5J4_9FLAO|nr:glycoside hydrolase family 16 protein [Winogradskyella sp. DF17]MBO3117116.1 glycoside hydrolase family 16 protein [Winogradskyella sp. DF17]